ncbi:hypothetical protein ARD30_20045 [Bosea thiooxidans]|uniref:Uncharacterized protein n=1 Tax=Bosea thiooxidans TaxID=53254 RepID=A0A0Q3KHB9_9HYPH|nr:hypothetical protein ARD30_20045 [Bosea thiooxidans]
MPSHAQQSARRATVSRQEAADAIGQAVPLLAGVEKKHASTRSAEQKSRGKAGGPSADNEGLEGSRHR